MKGYLVWLFLFLSVATSVIWWIFFRNISIVSTKTPINSVKIETYAEIKKEEEKIKKDDAYWYNKAISTKDSLSCEHIEDTGKKWTCKDMILALRALAEKDVNICGSIINESLKKECEEKIVRENAEITGDKTLCESLSPANANECRLSIDETNFKIHLSERTLTESFCQSLDISIRKVCTDALLKDKNEWTYKNAVSTGDKESCSLIPTENERMLCLDTITLKTALSSNDQLECKNITEEKKRLYCETTLQKVDDWYKLREYISRQNLEWCASLKSPIYKNRCTESIIFSLVRQNKDTNLCQSLSGSVLKSACENLAK